MRPVLEYTRTKARRMHPEIAGDEIHNAETLNARTHTWLAATRNTEWCL